MAKRREVEKLPEREREREVGEDYNGDRLVSCDICIYKIVSIDLFDGFLRKG